MNIRFKLTLQFALMVMSILLMFTAGVYYFSSSYRENGYYGRLRDRATTAARLLLDVQEVDRDLLKIIDRNTQALFQEEIFIIDPDNKQWYSNTDRLYREKLDIEKVRQKGQIRFADGNRDYIGILYPYHGKNFVVVVSAIDIYGNAELHNLRIVLLSGFFISIGLVIIAGLAFAGRALQPISAVVEQVKRISIAKLNLRVNEGNKKDEIAQLAITFNQMLERLEDAVVRQRDFVSNAAHELHTPFAVIQAEIDYSLMQERPVASYISTLQRLGKEIRRLNALSGGLLDLARLTHGQIEPEFVTLRIDELLIEACSDLVRANTEYKPSINFDHLPDTEHLLLVRGNHALLTIAIRNLIDNACKFSASRSVKIILIPIEGRLRIKFEDEGIGIPPEDIEKIFLPFYRGSNSRYFGGHGLGLALCREIIRLHGGWLTAQSEVGRGSAFEINLPAKL